MTGEFFSQWGQDLPALLRGLGESLALAGASLAVGLPLGLALAVAVSTPLRQIRLAALVAVELGRAVPALVVMQIAYYGLPSVHITLSSFAAGTAALAGIAGAYSSEIFRAGIASVSIEQRDAASALGVGTIDTYRSIIIPQGIRVALPALLGLAIQIFQATALAFTIAVPELLQQAYQIGDQTFRFLSILILASLLYASIVVPAGFLVRWLEVRMGGHLTVAQR